ncbi:uncharacterized protein BDV14DRAFT_62434 [Aspergillus stella-maris]|uniref:uncharacterized protein n=1 Tax=Aspergillus stella-maris TaxID=1810926 RepID=UPI003CCCB9FF
MATDPDGDSQMASSPESSHSLSDIDAGARTPTQTTNPSAQFNGGASELSPPGSQTQVSTGMGDLDSSATGTGPEGGWSGTDAAQQPGASWMNKRAEEEYQRAMEFVVDLDFNLDEFGDPFDVRDMNEKLG